MGLPPGTLVRIGERKAEAVRITLIEYNEKDLQESQIVDINECAGFRETSTVTWINVDGNHNVEIVDRVGRFFDLHPLILEDVLNTNQRPKFEDYDSHLFLCQGCSGVWEVKDLCSQNR